MSQYIISIVPVVDEHFTGTPAQATIRVEMSGGRATVRELIIRSPEDEGLVDSEIPEIDFGMLLRALTPLAHRDDGTPPVITRIPVGTTDFTSGTASGTQATARRKATSRRRSGEGVAAITHDPAAVAKLAHLQAGRAYRRAPAIDELERAYLEFGSIAGVAEHFGVPVHTAQGWVSRMRRRNTALTAK